MRSLTTNTLDLPLEVRAEMALKEAVQGAVDHHIRAGLAMYIWRDGEVAEISPDELRSHRKSSQPCS